MKNRLSTPISATTEKMSTYNFQMLGRKQKKNVVYFLLLKKTKK